MKKITDFLKSNILVVKWTAGYFVFLWILLKFMFNFNILSAHHWWKFFHATLHGLGGLVFGTIIYSAIPIYLATTLIIYRKKTAIISLPFSDKTKAFFEKIKSLLTRPTPTSEPEPEKNTPEPEPEKKPEYPADMPRELYIPYTRAKQNIPLTLATSAFNKQQKIKETPTESNENESFPIPSDFDISEMIPDTNTSNEPFSGGEFPVFKDLDFDTPTTQNEPQPNNDAPDKTLINSATKYFAAHNTEYETYHDFIATEKYLVYDHNDGDFWIMDDDNWFASKKTRESPIPELLELAHQNNLIPVLYLESQNIMDLPGTTEHFESMGIRVVKSLEELE